MNIVGEWFEVTQCMGFCLVVFGFMLVSRVIGCSDEIVGLWMVFGCVNSV